MAYKVEAPNRAGSVSEAEVKEVAYYVNIMRGERADCARPFLALSDPAAVRAVLRAVRVLVDESEAAMASAQSTQAREHKTFDIHGVGAAR